MDFILAEPEALDHFFKSAILLYEYLKLHINWLPKPYIWYPDTFDIQKFPFI